jgi:hypothetical protein
MIVVATNILVGGCVASWLLPATRSKKKVENGGMDWALCIGIKKSLHYFWFRILDFLQPRRLITENSYSSGHASTLSVSILMISTQRSKTYKRLPLRKSLINVHSTQARQRRLSQLSRKGEHGRRWPFLLMHPDTDFELLLLGESWGRYTQGRKRMLNV